MNEIFKSNVDVMGICIILNCFDVIFEIKLRIKNLRDEKMLYAFKFIKVYCNNLRNVFHHKKCVCLKYRKT